MPLPLSPLLASAGAWLGEACLWLLAALGVFVFFSLTILIHEGGHFLAAKALGLRADVFSLGFGPVLWKRRWRGTEYRLSAIPFGGFVALPQLDPVGMENIQGGKKKKKKDGAADDPAKAPEKKKEFATPLPPAAWWKRVLVAVAGPLGNVVFAVLLSFVVWALPPPVPLPLQFGGAVVGAVEKDSDAEAAGLRAGDRILAVAGKPVASWDEFVTEAHLVAESDRIALSVSNLYDGAVADLSAALSRNELGYNVVSGALRAAACGVGEIFPGGAAEAAGLEKDDVVLAVDGRRPVSPEAFSRLFGEALAARAEDPDPAPVRVRYFRKGRAAETEIAFPIRTPGRVPTRWTGLGAVVGNVATNLAPGSLEPEPSPFRAGDRILAAAGEPVDGWVGLAFRLAPAARAGEAVAFSVSNLLDGTVREVSAVPFSHMFERCRATSFPSPFGPDPAGRPRFLAHDGLGLPGAIEPAPQCLVSGVFRDSPGEEAGIAPGDVLAALEGVPVLSFDDFQGRVRNSGGRTLALTLVGKDGRRRDVAVTPREMSARRGGPKRFMVGIEIAPAVPGEETWAGMLAGFAPVAVDASVPQWARERLPGAQLEGDAKSIWRILGPLVGKAHKGERARIGLALGGPVIILKAMWTWFLVSFTATLAFVRFLNVNLAIINLLPIPVLDGGHVVFALWRGATGRELPPRVIEALVNLFGLLIVALFLWLSLHDVWSISKLLGSR